MTRSLMLVATAAVLLAGCGVAPAPLASSPAYMAAVMSHKATARKLDRASFAYGQAIARRTVGKPMLTTTAAPQKIDPYSYDFGRVVGYLEGAEDCYNNLDGSFNADQWKNVADQQYKALVAAEKLIQGDAQLASTCAEASGLIKGAIASYDNLDGSFNAEQWKNFAYTNYQNVAQAINLLLKEENS